MDTWPAIQFFRAETEEERAAINTFLRRHNARGEGSNRGYVAYYAAAWPPDSQAGPSGDRPLLERLVAAAKLCPLHTPQAARFFGGEDWRHVYVMQRLAAHRAPENLLSRFVGWCLREIGKDARIWYVATYADSGTFNPRTGVSNGGALYRATNAIYGGMSQGGRVEGYLYQGRRHSLRRGPRTLRLCDVPAGAGLIRSGPKHRYCWAVGPPLARARRRRRLERRMARFRYVPAYQPRLLFQLARRLMAAFGRTVPGQRRPPDRRRATAGALPCETIEGEQCLGLHALKCGLH